VIWRPWTAHHNLNPGQVARGHLITVLVFLYLFVVDQVGYIDEHSAGVNLATANVLLERIENLVNLDRKSTGLSLALPLTHRFFAKFAEVFATDSRRKFNFLKGFAQRAILDQQLQVHFCFALQADYALQKSFAVQPDRAAQGVIRVEHGSKAERKNGGAAEALTHHVCVLQQGSLSEFGGRDVFTHDDRELSARIREGLGIANTFKIFNGDGSTGSNTILEGLLLNDAVRVPCHGEASPCRKNAYDRLEFVESGETCEELSDERLSDVHQAAGEFSSH